MLNHILTSHPALPGHFPGQPVVPGVVIIDHVLEAAAVALPAWQITGIRKLKFLRPLLPSQLFSVELAEVKNGRVRFVFVHENNSIAEGNLMVEAQV
jgi:3-hydroxymyristoyl/3-hydroxydecanoyl-(acyl carrier protein) dehydratase